MNELEKERPAPPKKKKSETLEEHCERFMARRRESGEFSANRMKKQGVMLRLVCDRIGQAQFTKVTGEVLDQFYRDLMAGDTPRSWPKWQVTATARLV